MPQTDIMKKNMPLKEWLPLLGMTFSAFVVNTSEFMPIGLLTNIAADFGITEAHAGLLISVYAWVVMLLSLPLMLLVCRMEMRKLLLCTLALFGVCQILSTVSGSFGALMASRIGVACSHAVFWSIASPIAVRVVSEEHRPLALSMIVTGSSVAMIFGLPLGRAIGLHIGWRMTFLCVGLLAFAIFAYLLKVAPRLPSRQTFTLRELPRLLRNPLLLGIYWLAALVATAYYTAYSYIEPFLKQVAQLPESWITMTLALFGEEGIPYVMLYYMVNTTMFWVVAVHDMASDAGVAAPWLSRKTLKVVLNPPLLGFLAGIILVMLDWRLPMPIEASFRYLGGMTTPLAMLFIGIAISKASWSEIKFDRELTAAMVGRFVICPLCVMVCLPFFALPKLMSEVFIMQAAMPAMTNTSIVAKVYGGDYKYAAMLTVVSTLLAVITTPFYMWVLRG